MKKYIITLFTICSVIAFAQNNIDVSKIKDGAYIGNYRVNYKEKQRDYQAKVTVKGGKIESIILTKSGRKKGPELAKEVYKDIIGASRVDIDSISGATWKGLLEDALKTK